MSSKHMKMMSRSSQEEEEEWLEDGGQANGKTQSGGIRFKKNGRGSQLTKLEKIFILLLFLLTIALIVVIVALTIQLDKDDDGIKTINGASTGDAKVCTSMDCVSAAANIEAKLDHTVHPCDDFYQFTCGAWMKKRVIPGDRSSVNTFSELRNDVDIIAKNLLEAEISPTEPEYTAKAKTYYKSCLNYDLINKLGTEPLMVFLNKEFGGWPLITKNWDETSFDFTETIKKMNLRNIFPILALYVGINNRDSSQRILKIDQVDLVMPGQKYYLVPRNDTMLMAYETLIFKHGELFGFANPGTTEQEVKDIVNFEIELAEIMVPSEDRRDNNKLYNPMTLQEVQNNYSEIIDWKRLAYDVMEVPGIDIKDITDDEIVINRSPSYYEKLIVLLKNTQKRTLVNYLMWFAVNYMGYTQGDSIADLYKDYDKTLFGVDSVPPRYRRCVKFATRNMGLAVGKLFIKDNFDSESKTVALDMIKDLHHSFDELLHESDWMDEHTRKVAEEKNRYIAPKIGYPEEVNNETYMMEQYENFTFNPDTFLENSLVILSNSYIKDMKNLREPVDKKKALYNPSDVNAYYRATTNQIMFPAGILQPPFFKKTFPRSLNYGGIGVVIGHEITHGFDDRGRQYDKEGNLVQWWSQEAIDRFTVKSQCIVDQYSNYTVEGIDMNLNGINTQGENIADNGGLKESFNAYRNWVKRLGKEEDLLPGLEYSNDQLFFINFAQVWCSLMRDGDAIHRILTGVHSPGRFRVIGTLQNSEDFSRVFQCPNTSKMNPQKKCSVW